MTRVLTCGVWDLLHIGHIRLLERARLYGDHLIVGVQTDHAVTAIPGKQPPIENQTERAEKLAALRVVDEVQLYDSGTDGEIIRRVHPDIYVHGDDWHHQADRRRVLQALDDIGAELVLLPRTPGISTTDLRRTVSATRNR